MKTALPIVLFMLLAACQEQPSGAVQPEPGADNQGSDSQSASLGEAEMTAAAQAAVQDFSDALKSELMAAMQKGGPTAAIGICNTRAMPITRKVSERHGMSLRRVSLRYRNPANAPTDWQARVLEDFEARRAAGEALSMMTWSGFAPTAAGREFRYMQAIPTGELCLQCHGRDIAPEVRDILATLYPGDRATGFQPGDIRGAFVVTR